MKAVLAIPLLFAACADDADPVVSGAHHRYVVDRITLPTINAESRELGIDLNGDATPDNQLGMVIAALTSQGFAFQPALDRAVATGSTLVLVDIQTPDLHRTEVAAIELLLGASPSPSPCATPDDPVCGHHLDGSGTFAITGDRHEPLVGSIVDDVMHAGPGDTTIQLALGGTGVATIELAHARVRVESIDEAGVARLVVGGAVTPATVAEQMIPLFQQAINEQVARDCSPAAAPPGCGCPSGTGAGAMLGLFDDSPRDCAISLEEVRDNAGTQSLTSADVFLGDNGGLVSIGVGMTAVPATF
ncbi:MAG: hypothetical protein ABI867_33930 [Kofleriaceae bacterium]